MSDIDFDELDKAVNALAGQQDHHSVSVSRPAAASQAVSSAPASHLVRRSSPGRLSTAPRVAPGLRRGGSMDIIAKPVSRVGVDVRPPAPREEHPASEVLSMANTPPTPEQSEHSEPPVAQQEPPMQHSTAPAVAPEPAKAETAHAPTTNEWPDPLEFHGFANKDTAEPEPESHTQPETAPAVSPFLADTKVEKRPLGAFAHHTPQQPASPIHDELIEPSAATAIPNQEDSPVSQSTPKPDQPQPVEAVSTHELANMTIPPQYHLADKLADDSPRPIYDTSEYHPPLLEEHAHHAAPRRSKITMILALLSIATLMIIAGYLLFIYVSQA